MRRDGATIFGDLIGKLDVLRVECSSWCDVTMRLYTASGHRGGLPISAGTGLSTSTNVPHAGHSKVLRSNSSPKAGLGSLRISNIDVRG